jgi:hypothetical protein
VTSQLNQASETIV